MKKKLSRVLVVDASVARSAGETENNMSSACRRYLSDILKICHRIIWTDEIKNEWNKHMSRFTRKWLGTMVSRKKWIRDLSPNQIDLNLSEFSTKAQKTIGEDRHLLEAAFAADRVILTRDESLRSALNERVEGKKIVNSIKWINPIHDGIDILYRL